MPRVNVKTTMTAAVLFFLGGFPAHGVAESDDPLQYQQVSPLVIEDFAKAMKVSPDNPELRAVFEETNRQIRDQPFGAIESVSNAPYPMPQRPAIDSQSLDTTLPRLRVVTHIQFGEGLPFRGATPIVESQEWRAGTKAVVSYFQESMLDSARRVRETPALPDCVKSDLTRAALDSGNPDFDRARVDEFLYVRSPAPSDAALRFGATVAVIECGTEKGDSCAVAAKVTNIRCLPTRIVMRNGKVTRIEGSRALEKSKISVASGTQEGTL